MNGEQKITSLHRERLAVVYLRQSSMAQVREHTESTMRQYGLAEEAVRLGWVRSDVEVIDTDLGISGRWGVAREGFAELVTRVCRGEVGAIFGIEISRLARSNADVARLMEFARITDTLLIDSDGVYDPADVNDRMLLGLKGTISEALCRYRHRASQGYSSDRTNLWGWTSPGPGSVRACTTPDPLESSSPGSRPMPTAWTTWTGCGGPAASSARSAAMLVDGRWPMAGTSARPAASGRR